MKYKNWQSVWILKPNKIHQYQSYIASWGPRENLCRGIATAAAARLQRNAPTEAGLPSDIPRSTWTDSTSSKRMKSTVTRAPCPWDGNNDVLASGISLWYGMDGDQWQWWWWEPTASCGVCRNGAAGPWISHRLLSIQIPEFSYCFPFLWLYCYLCILVLCLSRCDLLLLGWLKLFSSFV